MKKRKNVIIPMMLVAAVAAASIPCSSQDVEASSNTYEVSVSKGYLALRSSMAYDSSNEIGELYSGDLVEVTEYTNGDYWYVYSPKYDCWGYVNNDYLVSLYSQSGGYSYSTSYTVSVSKDTWLSAMLKHTILLTKSGSYIPAIPYLFLTAVIHNIGMSTLRS